MKQKGFGEGEEEGEIVKQKEVGEGEEEGEIVLDF